MIGGDRAISLGKTMKGYPPFAPPTPLPDASTSPPPFRNGSEARDFYLRAYLHCSPPRSCTNAL